MLTHVTRNEQQWDAFVLAHGGGFLQSWGWSQFQEAIGRRVFRFRLDSSSEKNGDDAHADTIAQFTLLELPLPFGQRYAYVPRGPVVRTDGGRDEVLSRLTACVGALRETVARDGAAFARVEWPWSNDAEIASVDDIRRLGFVRADHVQPQDTVIVDLKEDASMLLAAMHQKTRYNIKVADKHGVVVREARRDDAHLFRQDVDLFWKMLDETAQRDKFSTHERSYYQSMIDVLSPKKSEGMRVRLMFAEFEGRAVAGALIGEFGDIVTYLHGASLAADRRVMAPYKLHWGIMQDAKARGFAAYDFWGVAPTDDADHPWAGITRFKTGFGGKRVSYPGAWELPGNGFWYSLYRLARKMRRG
jgi:lipid II:glycine glycyltransferase (peptidoglycan interpeptide bridge formation enzyme)